MLQVHRKEIGDNKTVWHYAEYKTYDELFRAISFTKIYYHWTDLDVRHHYCWDWDQGDYENRTRDYYREAQFHRYVVTTDKGVVISHDQMLGEHRKYETERYSRIRTWRWRSGSKRCYHRRSRPYRINEFRAEKAFSNDNKWGVKQRKDRDAKFIDWSSNHSRHFERSWKHQSKRKRQYKVKPI